MLWTIGYGFTLGLYLKQHKGFWFCVAAIAIWPAFLGEYIAEKMWRDKDESPW